CLHLCSMFSVALLFCVHSLYYEYTIQSRHSKNDIFDFTAMTVLDGRQIDSYRIRTPKQDWWKKLPQRGLQTGTDELQEYGHWLNDHLHSIIKELGQKKSGEKMFVSFSKTLFYNNNVDLHKCSRKWKASVKQVQHTAERWNSEHGQNIVLVRSPPVVYAFVKKFVDDPIKLTLICLATGFYPKDVMMKLIMSSGVRPNDDTYQLRKSVDILENDDADYDCYVTHSSLKGPVINIWGKCSIKATHLQCAHKSTAYSLLTFPGRDRNGQTNTTSNGCVTCTTAPPTGRSGSDGHVTYTLAPTGRSGSDGHVTYTLAPTARLGLHW
uniref:Ig-like domain-containing protein n=1 Tax=Electrophorus electricus TaxID=8005 RepID=A0A4W4E3B2_ELEEL